MRLCVDRDFAFLFDMLFFNDQNETRALEPLQIYQVYRNGTQIIFEQDAVFQIYMVYRWCTPNRFGDIGSDDQI